jgi:hypothetical protein
MKIIEEKEFTYMGDKFIARRYIPDENWDIPLKYGEIVYKDNGKRPKSMKNIAKQYLRPFGIEISNDASVMNTHTAVGILIQHLNKAENNGEIK